MWLKKEFLVLTYEIPKNFKISTNKIYSGIHWTQRKIFADYFHQISFEDCREIINRSGKINFLISCKFKFYFKSRYLDHLNLAFMAKTIEDWFVCNWLINDDTNKFIKNITLESVLIDKKVRKSIKSDYVDIIFYKNI